VRYGLESVDVQAAIGFIQNGIFRLEHGQLQNFSALLFAAGETLINCPGRKRPVHAEQLHFFIKLCVIVGGLEFFAFRQPRLQRCA
jgi:hypothetical protein